MGTASGQFLKLGAGARASGLGEAYAAVADDATSVYWNPAGMCQIEGEELALMHAFWFEDIYYDWISAVLSTGAGKIGVGVQYLSYGSITETDETGLATGTELKPANIAVTGAYATGLDKSGDLMLGVNIKYISLTIKNNASAFCIDAGLMEKIEMSRESKINIGLVAQNIGTAVKFIDDSYGLPLNVELGAAYYIDSDWLVTAEGNAPKDSVINYGGGVEYKSELTEDLGVAGRVGYNSISGMTLGAGIKLFENINVDYAYVPFGELGNTHRISLNISFDGTGKHYNKPKPKKTYQRMGSPGRIVQ
jgi:hypothetical protein